MAEEPTLSQLSFSQELTSSWQTMIEAAQANGFNEDMLVLALEICLKHLIS